MSTRPHEVAPRNVSFEGFTLDLARNCLLRGAEQIKLRPKSFDVLRCLVENRGRLVSKAELMDRVWPNTSITENSLAQCLAEIRSAIEDENQKLIKTVARRGYLLVGESAASAAPLLPSAVTSRRWQAAPDPRFWLAPAFGLLVLAGVYGFYRFERAREIVESPRSIAVLPFRSAIPTEAALGAGIADTLVASLSQVPGLTIREAGAGRLDDPIAAGKRLGVDSVLSGTLQRSGENLRITVRLVRVKGGTTLWADSFDGEIGKIFTLEDRIADRLTSTYSLKPGGALRARLHKRYTGNAEAYRLYLLGRYYFGKRTADAMRKATAFYYQALDLDPGYALAYAGLADSVGWMAIDMMPPRDIYPKAEAAARKALEIDPNLAEPHTSLGWIRMTYDHDWKAAEGEYKRAIALNPNYAMVHLWYSGLLEWQGRVEEAGSERQRAQELDPLSLSNNAFSGRSSLYARNYERAVEQCRTVLAMDPDYALAYVHLGRAYVQLARYIEGIRAFEKLIDLDGRVSESIAWLGFAYARAGRSAEARKLLVELEEQSTKNYVSSFDRALLYTGLGEKDRAFELLSKAVDERLAGVLSLRVNPEFDPLRSDPRFRELVRTIGLPPG